MAPASASLGSVAAWASIHSVASRSGSDAVGEPGGGSPRQVVARGGELGVERLDAGEEVVDDAAASHRQLAADEVDRLDAVGALVDRRDADVAVVLGDAGLLDEAHAAVDLDRRARRPRRPCRCTRPW